MATDLTIAAQTSADYGAHAWKDLQHWNRIGYLIILLGLGGFMLWATTAPLGSAVVSQGLVKVDSSRKKIQHLEGGTVKEILVKDGSRVKAGDILVRLDGTRAGASHGIVQSAFESSLAVQARLIAERDGVAAVSYPVELRERASDPKIAQIIRIQDEQFRARRQSVAGQIEILDRQIQQLRERIEGLGAQERSKAEQAKLLRDELAGLKTLIDKGMVEKTKVRNLEREIAQAEGERASHVSDLAATRATVSEKELEKFQVRKRLQEEVAAELRKIQSEVFDYQDRSQATRQTLAQTEIKAPVDGTVVELRVHTAGGVVGPGELLMEVVPDRDDLVVQGRIQPEDLDRLAVGLPTGVKLSAFNQRKTPELEGRLTYVSADAIEDEKTGMVYFVVKAEVSETELKRLGHNQIQPGMLAELYIRTGERTFFDYLMRPLLDSFDKAWRER